MTRLTLEDWRAFERVAMRQYHEKSTTTRAVYFGLFIAFGVAAAWLSDWLDSPLQLLGVFLGAALAWLSVWLTARAVRKSYVPDDDGAFLGEHAYELDAEGIRANRPGSSSLSSWSVVKAVSVTAEHLFIWLDKIHAFVVPLRSLPAGVGRDELIRHVERWWGSSVVPEAQRSATSRAQAAHDPAPVGCDASAHPGNLRSSGWTTTLLCLLTLRRTDAPGEVSVGVLALLTGLACGAWIGVDWLRNQPDPEFYSYGVPVFAWYALIALAITAVLARNSKPALDWQRVLAVVLAATPPLIVGSCLIDRFLSWPWTLVASLALLVYLIGYAVRALSALSGVRQPQALVSGIFVTLLLLWVTDWLYVEPSVWLAADAEAEDGAGYETAWKEAEPLLFSQAARIDEAIGAIEASSAGTPAVFFVGFAGYAEERVFAEEIKLATRVVGERYGTQARSVLLINDRRSLDAQPLASPTALRHALRGLATKMNTERDVLFLALSSHGSVDSLSVSNAPFMLQDLAATDLASALQESGIKWRVIVISACHAGSFIDELRDANTIVITASAAEKTSFGCSDERDLTYFGEAFYRDALPRAKSLRDAFEIAKADIGAREKHEDIEASDPQAFFGEEIERHLATLP